MRRRSGIQWFLLVAAVLYTIAAILAVAVFVIGLPGEPMAALPAMFLGMPWSLLTDTHVGGSGLWNSVLLTAPLLANGAILWCLYHLAGRKR